MLRERLPANIYNTEFNYKHPCANGIALFIVPAPGNPGTCCWEVSSGRKVLIQANTVNQLRVSGGYANASRSRGGGYAFVLNPSGANTDQAFLPLGAANLAIYRRVTNAANNKGFTIAQFASRVTDFNTNKQSWNVSTGTFGNTISMLWKGNSQGGTFNFNVGGNLSPTTATSTSNTCAGSQPYPFVAMGIHRPSNAMEMWVDTALEGTATDGQTYDLSANTAIALGDFTLQAGGVAYYWAAWWNRDLSPDEVRLINADPMGLMRKSRTFFYSLPTLVQLTQIKSDSINNYADAIAINNGAAANYGVIVNDFYTLKDGIAIIGGDPDFKLAMSDSLNLRDFLAVVYPKMLLSVSDSINNLADAISKEVGIPRVAFDSMQFNWADAVVAAFDGPLSITKGDSLSLSDAVATSIGNFLLAIHVADTINNITEALRIWNILKQEFGDNLTISDNFTAKFNHFASVNDSLNLLVDLARLDIQRRPAFADSLVLGDSASIALFVNLTKSASDTLALNDAVAVELDSNYPQAAVDRIRRYLNDIN